MSKLAAIKEYLDEHEAEDRSPSDRDYEDHCRESAQDYLYGNDAR